MSYGSGFRYGRRLDAWKQKGVLGPRTRHHSWWLLHNCVSHPLLGVRVSKGTLWLHDWTSMHLNCRKKIRPSPEPVIPNWGRWAWHNIAGHWAIGILPVEASFVFHDKTSENMNVPHWV